MIHLEMGPGALAPLFFIFGILWLIPIIMLVVGLFRLKTRPKNAKILIIIGGIWLLVAAGVCGAMMI